VNGSRSGADGYAGLTGCGVLLPSWSLTAIVWNLPIPATILSAQLQVCNAPAWPTQLLDPPQWSVQGAACLVGLLPSSGMQVRRG